MKNVALPIDGLLPELTLKARQCNALVLEAPPGAGKTTRVPRALLEQGVVDALEIWVLQPRRLPTRLAAARVAAEMGESIGETVGYQVRFEDLSGPKTKLRFVTEGVLTRRLLADARLENVGMVVLDEFHERHLAGDLTLALLRNLQQTTRPDLKLLVMSATLDTGPIASFLGNAPILRSEGRRFDVSIEYLPAIDTRPLDVQVLAGVKRLISQNISGDFLVFLPGAGEIRKAKETCAEFAERHAIEIHALHGDLTAAEQDKAVQTSPRRKLILSTNVAETSVTIDGVTAVIDSGLARIASHSPWSGLGTLKLAKISKASATQRAGRAGRTQAGHCLRLYTREDFMARSEQETPEIRRLDLAESVLALHAHGIQKPETFPFFEAPTPTALSAAESLLKMLQAINEQGELTPTGKRMMRFPLHPRQARLLVEAENRGVAAEGALLAAFLGERDIRLETRARIGPSVHSRKSSSPSDLLDMLDRFQQARESRFNPAKNASLGLETYAVQTVDRVCRQLSRNLKNEVARPKNDSEIEMALGLCILAGYPDRLAKRRKANSNELLLAAGGSALLSDTSTVLEPEFLVAVDVEERAVGRTADTIVRLASGIEPEWLLELFPNQLESTETLEWNESARRVERFSRLAFGGMVLEESRQPAPDTPKTHELLAQAVLAYGISRLFDISAFEQLSCRIDVLREAFPEVAFPVFDETFLQSTVRFLCEGKKSFSELEGLSLAESAKLKLSEKQLSLLATMLPERISLPGGRQTPVHYEVGKPPWVESRLQDFFGMAKGPALCQGRMALVIHLLAPNQRAVQVTRDLSGFWSRHYPSIRKELSRKYPRHFWPEDPLTAAPPAPNPRRK